VTRRPSLPILANARRAVVMPPARPAHFDPSAELVDAHGRRHSYLRLSVTDRCDLACAYCAPDRVKSDGTPRADRLTFEEMLRLIEVFDRCGIRRVRLTGGEPLVRKHLVELVRMIRAQAPALDVCLTTNGTRLAELARPLRDAGLASANVSLDSLDPTRFRAITGGGDLHGVLEGITGALSVGLPIKLNTVVLGGVNDDEVPRIVDFAWDLGVTPRFIEVMPIGEGALGASARLVPGEAIIASLGARVRPASWMTGSDGTVTGPARYVSAADGSGRRVGVIAAVSTPFCDQCNRLRITSDGTLASCLAYKGQLSLRDLMRAGAGNDDLLWAVHWALGHKRASHDFGRADAADSGCAPMFAVGG